MDSSGRTIWIVDAHRDNGKRFVVHADEKLTAFVEFESAILRVAARVCLTSRRDFFKTGVAGVTVHRQKGFGSARRTLDVMTTKVLVLLVLGLATACVVQAQIAAPPELPAESPSPEKKHRQHKSVEATTSPAETTASPATAESPTGLPKARRLRKKAQTEAAASPAAATPAASPTAPPKFRLGNLFRPRSSTSASPSAASVTGSTGTATPAPGGGHGLVWVNTETHVYHKEGSRFYGATKKGKYVSEADAIKEGDRAAGMGQ